MFTAALIYTVFLCFHSSLCWDSRELELFDLVEEINQNFYKVMNLSQECTHTEIKKAYRTLSKQLHPDKNSAPDAEIRFRQLVSVYEVLKDDFLREQYDRVLVEGLPDWRSPIYYYRRARKMSLLEILLILIVVVSFTQYCMAWGAYVDHWRTLEEALMKKYKIKERKKRRPEDLENISIIEKELNMIPKPSCFNILPIQLLCFMWFIVTGGPNMVRSVIQHIKAEKERKAKEQLMLEEEERKQREEEERRREKKAQQKARKRIFALPEVRDGCLLEAVDTPDEHIESIKPALPTVPVIVGGPWTDDEFSELTRLMNKYPGGTVDRWEKIAELMGRTVYEVTKISARIKADLCVKPDVYEHIASEIKNKVKTKGGKHLTEESENFEELSKSDEMWTNIQQKALEKALKNNPKGTDQRWERIARVVPGKTKEECILRYKYLAEKIKRKKDEGVQYSYEHHEDVECPVTEETSSYNDIAASELMNKAVSGSGDEEERDS